MSPPDDRTDDPQPSGEPRHPFTYRVPAPKPDAETPEPFGPADLAEEARRNDAVLMWAAGLMVAMFACTTVADSRVLVHVKTGQYLAANGVLPPANDVLSATAADRPWVNLAWLFDLAVAGLHALGGMTALTVMKVIAAAGVAALIFSSRRSGVSSWWASLVVVLAAVAAMPQLDASPEIVTLLGIGVTLRQLARYRQELDDRALWWLAPLFLVWSNLDPRMFLGLAVLLSYGLGELVGSALGRPGFEEGSRRGRYWLGVAAATAATLVNPFGWRAALGPLLVYGRVDPAFREYYGRETSWNALAHLPLTAYPFSAWLDMALSAGALLAVVALAAMLLNRRRLDGGDAAVWLGFVGLAVATGRELPAAAVVFAVLAIQNAEDWYRNTFRQTYAVERGELLFSRGGRAVTVLAFAALAGLWLMGKVPADDGRRPGFGLEASLAEQAESLAVLLEKPFDRKVFNFRPEQGDLLIWLGFKPYIDHRLELFGGQGGGESVIALHDDVRHALRAAAPDNLDTGRPEIWKPALEKFGVTQALPRLSPPAPDYRTYFDMLQSAEWRLVGLGAAGAVFYRNDTGEPKLAEYLKTRQFDITKEAFREPVAVLEAVAVWPRPRDWSDTWTARPRPSRELVRALHSLRHLEEAETGRIRIAPAVALAFAHLGIRDFNAALAVDPQSVTAYRGLAQAYEMLYLWETRIMQIGGSGLQPSRRLYQAISAYGQALAIEPEDTQSHERLMGLYLGFGKADLAEHARNEFERLTGREPAAPTEAGQWDKMWEELRTQIETVTERAREAVAQNEQRLEAAFFAWQNGCTRLALDLIDEDETLASADRPDVRQFRAMLLLEAARPQEAFELLAAIEPVAVERGMPGFREPFALACLALPDFARAEALWRDEAETASDRQLITAMQAVPLAGPLNGPAGRFPAWQSFQAAQAMFDVPQEAAKASLNASLCDLEAGRVKEAEEGLTDLLGRNPATPATPIAKLYLELIRGKAFDLDFGPVDVAADRYSASEAALDAALSAQRIKAAGPVQAPKPQAAGRSAPAASGAGASSPGVPQGS